MSLANCCEVVFTVYSRDAYVAVKGSRWCIARSDDLPERTTRRGWLRMDCLWSSVSLYPLRGQPVANELPIETGTAPRRKATRFGWIHTECRVRKTKAEINFPKLIIGRWKQLTAAAAAAMLLLLALAVDANIITVSASNEIENEAFDFVINFMDYSIDCFKAPQTASGTSVLCCWNLC